MTTLPLVTNNSARSRFEIDLGDGEFAFAAYDLLPGAIRFTHTLVPESHGGHGLGTELVKAGLRSARERGLKVIPVCPFFRTYLRKHADEQDIVDPDHVHLLHE